MLFRRIGFVLFLGALIGCALPAWTQTPQAPPPEKVDQLIKLLADPAVKDWLSQQLQATNPPAGVAPVEAEPQANAQGMEPSMVSTVLERVKRHLEGLAMAWPGLPAKYQRTSDILTVEFAERGVMGIALIIAFFVAVGVGLAYLALRLTRPLRLWIIALPHDTPQGRVKKVGGRFLLVLILVGAFMLGSAGAFLMFEWPPLLREIVLAYLTAAIVIWAARMFARFVLLPPNLQVVHAREVRVLDVDDERAAHWYRWIVVLVVVFALVAATFSLLPTFGFMPSDLLALAVPADLLLLVLGLAAVWLRPLRAADDHHGRVGHTAKSWLLTPISSFCC